MTTHSYIFLLLFFYCSDFVWNDDDSDSDFDNMHQHDEYSHSEIINQCNFGSKHIINARLSSQTCLQHQADSSTQNAIPQCLNSNDFDSNHGAKETDDPTRIHTLRKYVGQAKAQTSFELVIAKQ